MTKDEAFAANQKFYADQRGCKHGHTPARRYSSTGNCAQCAEARYKNPQKPLLVMVPPQLHETFKAMCSSLGCNIVQRASKQSPLLYVAPGPALRQVDVYDID